MLAPLAAWTLLGVTLAAPWGAASAQPTAEPEPTHTVTRTTTQTVVAARTTTAAPPAPSPGEAPAAAPTSTPNASLLTLPGGIGLDLHGFLHVDSVVWDQSSLDALDPATGLPLNETRVFIRQARVRLDLRKDFVTGGFELDGNTIQGPRASVVSADLTLRWPWSPPDGPPLVALTAGLLKIPFGISAAERIKTRMFLDAPTFVRGLFPGEYDLGVVLHGGWRFVRYAIAAMNGSPAGAPRFGGRDPESGKDLLGRVGVDLRPTHGLRVQSGLSALTGTGLSPGTPSTKDQLSWRDLNENGLVELTELQVIPGAAAIAPRPFDRLALGADLRVIVELPVLGELVVFGEFVWAQNLDRGITLADPITTGRPLREAGLAVGAYTELGPRGRLGVRYDRYDPDADAVDPQGAARVPYDATLSTLSVVAEWRVLELASIIVGYDHNENAFGRRADGTPGRLPDDSVIIRAALGF
jgi:hypothetical protein